MSISFLCWAPDMEERDDGRVIASRAGRDAAMEYADFVYSKSGGDWMEGRIAVEPVNAALEKTGMGSVYRLIAEHEITFSVQLEDPPAPHPQETPHDRP